MCHCLACQRRTGSAFGAQARFEASAVETEGRWTEYRRRSDEGFILVVVLVLLMALATLASIYSVYASNAAAESLAPES